MTTPAEIDELRAKAELLELLSNATQDSIVDWNLISGEAEYSPRWKRLWGADESELAGRLHLPELWQELIHPDERSSVVARLRDHFERAWPFTTTARMRHRSGDYRHVLCRGSALRDAEGRPLRMVIIFSDIEERIRDEARQRALASALPDTLFRVRADETISGVKRGREREDSPFAALREGMTLQDCFSDGRLLARLRGALSSSTPEPQSAKAVQLATVTDSGADVYYEVRVVRSADDESVCIVRDVTEQRELEERLLETQKLGAIGQLAAGVAHEINTPMQFIGDSLHFVRGAVSDLMQLLERYASAVSSAENQPLGPARLRELRAAAEHPDFVYVREELPLALARSLEGVERVTKIVRAMKSFAHPGGNQLVPTDLRSLIESTVMVATNEWKYVAEVKLELDPELQPVPCIAGEVNQVILNLIVNASHAIADVVGASGEKGCITISAWSDDSHVELRVADTGTGIAERARAKVFEPFFTTKEVGRGTGQGLAMAYNCVVKRHKGSISFDTELGVGTTFIVRLPLAPPLGSQWQSVPI